LLSSLYEHALCIHPYYQDSHAGSLGLAVFPPIGLEYVMAALQPHVNETTFVDLRIPGPLRDLKKLKGFIEKEIDLLCVSINWEYHFPEVCALINSLPSQVTTIVGGQQATDSVEEVFQLCPFVDILVRGEGEETIAEIAQGIPLKDILGISYRNGSQIVHNANRPLGEIDRYLPPNRGLRSQEYNLNFGGYALPLESFDMLLTSRGCPYNCKFCTFNLNPWTQKRRYSVRPIDAVMDEINQIKAGIILIADENFFVNPNRAKEICERLIANGVKKRFLVQARIEIFERPDVLEAAAKAGIKVFLLGIESPSDRILEQLNKGFDTSKLRKAFEEFRKHPFYYHGYFIYGNVTETEQEMLRIPEFAKELGLDSITYQKLRVDRYSPLRELVEATPGYYVGDDRIVYLEGFGRPGLKRISREITRRFYTPSQLISIIRKLFSVEMFTPKNIPALLSSLPMVLTKMIGRKIDKKARRLAARFNL
jgi:radical SAM superfamily enzyme YgiQ (UPF0313 family)